MVLAVVFARAIHCNIPLKMCKVCKLSSTDGFSTAYCSQKSEGNTPTIVTSCYQTPLQPSECVADDANTDNRNSKWCTVSLKKEERMLYYINLDFVLKRPHGSEAVTVKFLQWAHANI